MTFKPISHAEQSVINYDFFSCFWNEAIIMTVEFLFWEIRWHLIPWEQMTLTKEQLIILSCRGREEGREKLGERAWVALWELATNQCLAKWTAWTSRTVLSGSIFYDFSPRQHTDGEDLVSRSALGLCVWWHKRSLSHPLLLRTEAGMLAQLSQTQGRGWYHGISVSLQMSSFSSWVAPVLQFKWKEDKSKHYGPRICCCCLFVV